MHMPNVQNKCYVYETDMVLFEEEQPSHQNLNCLPFCFFFYFRLKPLFVSVEKSKFKKVMVHFRNSGIKRLNQVLSIPKLCPWSLCNLIVYLPKAKNREDMS